MNGNACNCNRMFSWCYPNNHWNHFKVRIFPWNCSIWHLALWIIAEEVAATADSIASIWMANCIIRYLCLWLCSRTNYTRTLVFLWLLLCWNVYCHLGMIDTIKRMNLTQTCVNFITLEHKFSKVSRDFPKHSKNEFLNNIYSAPF